MYDKEHTCQSFGFFEVKKHTWRQKIYLIKLFTDVCFSYVVVILFYSSITIYGSERVYLI